MDLSKNESLEIKSFDDERICEEMRIACKSLNYTTPTKIQSAALPYSLTGHDIIALAETGSGKTLAFALPMLQQLLSKYIQYHIDQPHISA
jgi:superfamily II DNA/RNA helicase